MRRIQQFWTLAGLTALEAIRQPICLLLTTSCVIATALAPLLLMHQFGEEGRLARDSGLAFHFVFGLFVAGFTACSSLTREIRNGTASAVLSKPVSRDMFFLAKFAGIAAVVMAFSVCATMATLLSERVAERYVYTEKIVGYITDFQTGVCLDVAPLAAYLVAGFLNYRKRRPFESTAFAWVMALLVVTFLGAGLFDRLGQFHPFHPLVQWRIVPASLLVTMALLILAAVALALSTRLSPVMTLTGSSGLFVLGLLSDFLFGRHSSESPVAGCLYRLIPNWQHFWMPDALANGGAIPAFYLAQASLYFLLCLAGVLCLGMLSFNHAEVN